MPIKGKIAQLTHCWKQSPLLGVETSLHKLRSLSHILSFRRMPPSPFITELLLHCWLKSVCLSYQKAIFNFNYSLCFCLF